MTDTIKELLASLPLCPGIYKMLDKKRNILYVGKAKNLKKRVSSYFQNQQSPKLSEKTSKLVKKIAKIETTVTHNETEALILEQQLIKAHQPPYNILLRDDKSYPYLYLSKHQEFPYLIYKRTVKTDNQGYYFGPYPNSYAVRNSLKLLQKLFKIRSCNDTFFKHRTRPCLEYQIGRCSAPCVNKISSGDYQEEVQLVKLFLQGKNTALLQTLAEKMERAAKQLAFEQASKYRDQLIGLQNLQNEQDISKQINSSLDIFTLVEKNGLLAIGLLMVRQGKVRDFFHFFPKNHLHKTQQDVLVEVIAQYYLGENNQPCAIILTNLKLEPLAQNTLEKAVLQAFHHPVKLQHQARAQKAKWLNLAVTNTEQQINSRLKRKSTIQQQLLKLQQWLGLEQTISRMECFDISHSSGESAVASCVVFNQEGALKSAYRSYNMKNITASDDYAAIHQAVYRRYKNNSTNQDLPDILFVDGGKGQLKQALIALKEVELMRGQPKITIIAIAKGVTRKPGLETLFITHNGVENFAEPDEAHLATHAPELHIIQQIRDEAHRFALSRHKKRRAKARQHSQIENITGIGSQRARQLLNHFGSYDNLCQAGIKEITKVQGISEKLATQIYQHVH